MENLRPLATFLSQLTNETNVSYVFVLLIFWLFWQKHIQSCISRQVWRVISIFSSMLLAALFLSFRLPILEGFNDFSAPIIIVSCVAFLFLFYRHAIRNDVLKLPIKVMLTWLFLPVMIIFSASFILPMFLDSYLIFLTPAFMIIFAFVIIKLDAKLWLSVSLFVTILMAVSFSPISNNKIDVKKMVKHVRDIKI